MGKIFGCLWLMYFPFEQPKRGFLLFNILKGIFMCSMILGSWMGNAIEAIFCLLMLGIGFVKVMTFLTLVYIGSYEINQHSTLMPEESKPP